MTSETDNASIKALITQELKAPFLLLAFIYNRINRQFREH
ncbi:Uncharacterised protein [Enterobacter hormaechei]|nr:Uncharacterised protein [Enterobacter hormaechei]